MSAGAGAGADENTALLAAADGATSSALPGWLRTQRWFGAKGRALASVTARDAWCAAPGGAGLVLLDVAYADGSPGERYVAALVRAGEGSAPEGAGAIAALRDATDDPGLVPALLAALSGGARGTTARGARVFGRPAERAEHRDLLARASGEAPQRLRAEQSNTSYRLGDLGVLKLLRRLQPGAHPDDEVVRYLSARGFPHVPPALGTLWYQHPDDAEPTALALAQAFVVNRGDAWAATLHALEAVIDGADPGPSLASVRALGAVTGELHAALAAAGPEAPAFVPGTLGAGEREGVAAKCAARLERIRDVAARSAGLWDAELPARLESLVRRAQPAVSALRDPRGPIPDGLSVIRVHGDYHLGQVLVTDTGFALIDFEGEPALPLEARRARASALRDVAGMMRSLDYASHVAAREVSAREGDDGAPGRAAAWERSARAEFLRGYRERVKVAKVALVPADEAVFARALAAYELEKSLYEVLYEIDHRPAWVTIPALGVERALDALGF